MTQLPAWCQARLDKKKAKTGDESIPEWMMVIASRDSVKAEHMAENAELYDDEIESMAGRMTLTTTPGRAAEVLELSRADFGRKLKRPASNTQINNYERSEVIAKVNIKTRRVKLINKHGIVVNEGVMK